MLVGRAGGKQAAEVLVRALRRAVGRVTEVDVRLDPVGDDVRRDPPFDPSDARDLGEHEPADLDGARLDRCIGQQPFERLRDRVLRQPRPGRVAADAVKDEARVQVAEATRLNRAVGGLEQDRELGLGNPRNAVEEVRERALGRGQLLSRKEEEVEIHGLRRTQVLPSPSELDHHRDSGLHVAGPEPDNLRLGDVAGNVLLRRDGVEVSREDDERALAEARAVPERLAVPPGRLAERRFHVRGDLCFFPALRRDVDQVERARRQPLREVWVGGR